MPVSFSRADLFAGEELGPSSAHLSVTATRSRFVFIATGDKCTLSLFFSVLIQILKTSRSDFNCSMGQICHPALQEKRAVHKEVHPMSLKKARWSAKLEPQHGLALRYCWQKNHVGQRNCVNGSPQTHYTKHLHNLPTRLAKMFLA
jgi:hypothetical protein